tara:strand:+ start:1686 stop:1844 length:159 start_codon:yes stop_codon:yes gene_type:complete
MEKIMEQLKKTILVAAFSLPLMFVAACDQDGPMEEAGESLDEATEDLDDSFQ